MKETVILTQEILDECKRNGWAIVVRFHSPNFPRIRWNDDEFRWEGTAVTADAMLIGKEARLIK